MSVKDPPNIVIIGAGFGGLFATRALAHAPVDVTLIDRNNYHAFWPLLYQVGAAEVEPEGIVYPVRSILRRQKNAQFALGEVKTVDFQSRVVKTENIDVPYDYLIVATGSASNFFDIPGAQDHSFPLKTMEQGEEVRNQILSSFEHAAHEPDPERRKQLLTFVIVGGGATGTEFAGALAELINHPLRKDYPALDFSEVKVILIEAMDRLLPGQFECCYRYAEDRLRAMGVDIRLGVSVSEVTRTSVTLKDGMVIPTQTIIWTAGVQGDPLARSWGLPTARGGRVPVLPTLQLSDHPEVYVIGDLAYFEEDGKSLPMIAPVAIQQATAAAKNIVRTISGKAPEPFKYNNKGLMTTIGRNAAVAEIGGRGFTGFIAWIIWVVVHIYNLIGFRNRILVLINWAWDYFFFERTVRLITR